MNTYTPNDIADYIVRNLYAAGENITLQRLNNLLFQVQGWALALLGRPAFTEAIKVTPGGPHIATVVTAYQHHQGGPITPSQSHRPKWNEVDVYGTRSGETPGASRPDAALEALINSVLRTYDNAYALHQAITTSPLWAHSCTTESRVEQANLAAYFKLLPPLSITQPTWPTVLPWPAVYEAVDTAALHRQALREAIADQEAQDQAMLDRMTNKAPAKPGLLAKLGLTKGGE